MKMKNGFTIVELMIVVAIIAVLAAIAIPSFQKAKERNLGDGIDKIECTSPSNQINDY